MKKLNLILSFLTLLILLISCSNSITIIEGQYYQQKIDFFSTYNLKDSLLVELEKLSRNEVHDTLCEKNKEDIRILKHAVEYNLLRRPFIRLKSNNGEKLMLYMSLEEFNQFKDYKLSETRKGEKVVALKAKVKDISFDDHQIYDLIRFKFIDKKNTEKH